MNLIPSTAQRRRWSEIVISTWDAGLTYLQFLMARGQADNPHDDFSLASFLHGFRNLVILCFSQYGPELQSISEFNAGLLMSYFGSGPYSTFHTYILGITKITSKRTLWYLELVWFCMYGIQFPTDPMMDQFLSSVCLYVFVGVICVSGFCLHVCVCVSGYMICVCLCVCVCLCDA